MSNANLRMCESPECSKWFTPKNDGGKCCCIKCKNRKNYLFASLEYFWEFVCTSQRKKNYKVLEYLLSINRIKVTRELLELMGFDFCVCFAPLLSQEGDHYYRFGNSLLKQISEDEFEIKYYDYEKIY